MLPITQCSGTWSALQTAIIEMATEPGVKAVFVLACESNGEVPEVFDQVLRELSIPVFGGVFPALIADGNRLEHGNIVLGLDVATDVYVIPSLSGPSLNYDTFLNDLISPNQRADAKTMLTFVDGLAPRVGDFIASLFNTFGLQGNFIGGGAGSLVTPNFRCLITPQGVIRDAAVIAIPHLSSRVCVAHGWESLAGPFEVTESENNVILSLDWEPALNVYRQVVEAHQDGALDTNNFGSSAQSHPFGMTRLNAEFVVRDPIAIRADGGLICVGDVPRGSLVHIMTGDQNTLLTAAKNVRSMVDKATPTGVRNGVDLFIDCISRSMFLGDHIAEELQAVRHPSRPQIGAFTLGEIANSGQEYLEFHNKTAVVATLWENNELG